MKIGWVGFHMEGLPALNAVLQAGYPVEAVITLKEDAAMKRSAAADYESVTSRYHVPLHKVTNINHEESVNLLRNLKLDVVFVIGWSQILSPEVLKLARIGMIGGHASLLPHNRGSAPINWAIINGETETGNSLIWLAEQVDTGGIIDQMPFPISVYDTCESLYWKVAETNREMILKLIPQLMEGKRPGRPQPHTDEAILTRRRPQDGAIDWTQESRRVYNFIRALTRPYPGAFSWLDGKRWFVWQCADLSSDFHSGRPGEIIGPVVSPSAGSCGQAVVCGKGILILLELQNEDGTVLRGPELSDQLWQGKVWMNEGQ